MHLRKKAAQGVNVHGTIETIHRGPPVAWLPLRPHTGLDHGKKTGANAPGRPRRASGGRQGAHTPPAPPPAWCSQCTSSGWRVAQSSEGIALPFSGTWRCGILPARYRVWQAPAGCKRLAGEGERGAANIPKSPGYCWSTPTYRNWCAQHASFEGTKAEQTSPRKSTPRTLKGLTNSIRPFLRQAGAPGYRSSLGVEQPMPEICVRLAPLPRVFRQSVRCWSSIGAPIRRIKSGWKVLGEAGTCASRFFAPLLPAALLTRSPRDRFGCPHPCPR